MREAIEGIFTVNLGVKRDERVVVFTDLVRDDESLSDDERRRRESLREIAGEVSEAGRRFCRVSLLEFPSTGAHGKEPPIEAWEMCFGREAVDELRKDDLLERIMDKKATREDIEHGGTIVKRHAKDAVDCVVALSNYSTSHTRFRDYLTGYAGARYASMPLFEASMFEGAMRADWNMIKERTERLVSVLHDASLVHISSPNGTDITFSIEGRHFKADTGILTSPGSFGNLPAGEAFVAPVEGTANGMLVLEWAPTRRLVSPVTLKVRDGMVVDVAGKEEFVDELWNVIRSNPLTGNIAELGIGTNDKATRPDNILETEKILGTIHIAIGDNSSFGGRVSVPFHQDFILFRPTVRITKDKEIVEVLKEGKPLF